MRIKFITVLILLLPFFGYSQGEFNNWFFGTRAAITFNTSPPTNIPSTQMLSVTGTVSASDSNGLVLFYSNGNYLYNRNHNIMSTLVWGMNSNQPVFAFKQPGSDHLYLIFSLRDPQALPLTAQGLFSSVIDMTLNGGLGGVTPTHHNIPVPGAGAALDKLSGTRHHNNKDAWIVTRDTNNHFLAYLVSSAGISGPVISTSSVESFTSIRNGDLKISQDGRKMVANYCNGINGSEYDRAAEFCSFNAETGTIVPMFTFKPEFNPADTCFPHWAEFSPNSQLLYIGVTIRIPPNTTKFGIFQYDATRNDSAGFMNSQVFLGYVDGPGGTRALQMAPDGKIYSCFSNSDILSVIIDPNVQGPGCGFQINGFNLNGKICHEGLPQFLQKYKAYIEGTSAACKEAVINFSSDIWPPADTIRWDFGDPVSGNKNTSTLANPGHAYLLPGTYTVTLYVRHNDARTDTTLKSVTINPKPSPALGSDRVVCLGSSATFDAGTCTGCSYVWENLTTGQPNVGTGQTYTTDQPGLYAVAVTSDFGCVGGDTIQLSTSLPPVSTTDPISKTICSGEMTAISLTSTPASTIYTWIPALTSGSITGLSADSGVTINPTLINNGANPGVVTYHITPKIGDCAGAPIAFVVTVNPEDPVNVSVTASATNICDGTPVTFTATAVNPGSNPIFQWLVNGTAAGSNSMEFNYIPVNGDVVKCMLTSSNTVCITNNPATSNAITMVVNPIQPVSVTVSPSANPACSGTTDNFTALPVNGGNNPSWLWKVNGLVVGSNAPAYSYAPVNGDAVTCTLTSDVQCPSGNPAQSNPVTMVVNVTLPAGVTISASANPFCPGSAVTFTASPVNGGANPGYQWKVNGTNAGTNASAFTYNPQNNDSVQCILTSNLNCVTGNPVSSAKIIMLGTLAPTVTFAPCFDTVTTLNAKPFRLKGGLPLGGTWSGPGANSVTGLFDPAQAGVGTHSLTYSCTNAYECEASISVTIVTRHELPFSCGNTMTDIRDNKSYPTVQISTQCWMASNLGYGMAIDELTPQTDNCVSEYYITPGDFSSSHFTFHSYRFAFLNSNLKSEKVKKCETLNVKCDMRSGGALYQWDELMCYSVTPGAQGLCPPGWHVPTETEWTTLLNFYQSASRAGRPLQDPVTNGFRAIPGGIFYSQGFFRFDDFATFFWSSTPSGSERALAYGMNTWNFSVSLYPAGRGNAFAVRCLRD